MGNVVEATFDILEVIASKLNVVVILFSTRLVLVAWNGVYSLVTILITNIVTSDRDYFQVVLVANTALSTLDASDKTHGHVNQ